MDVYRQGDVLLIQVQRLPDDVEAEIDPNRLILAYGEATGHAHRISGPGAGLFQGTAGRFLRLTQPADLVHPEHGTILLKPGTYRVVQQKEYTPEAIRPVAD